jgi:hypothetical protein
MAQPHTNSRNAQFLAVACFGLAGVLLIPFRRTKRAQPFALVAALACLLILPACGGGGGGTPTPSPGTPHGTSIFVITGTTSAGSVTVTHTLNLTLTVN